MIKGLVLQRRNDGTYDDDYFRQCVTSCTRNTITNMRILTEGFGFGDRKTAHRVTKKADRAVVIIHKGIVMYAGTWYSHEHQEAVRRAASRGRNYV